MLKKLLPALIVALTKEKNDTTIYYFLFWSSNFVKPRNEELITITIDCSFRVRVDSFG